MDISNIASEALAIVLPYLKDIAGNLGQDLKEGTSNFLKKKISDLFKIKASSELKERLENTKSSDEDKTELQNILENNLKDDVEFFEQLQDLLKQHKASDAIAIKQTTKAKKIKKSVTIGILNGKFKM
jgi:hypothetical protein